MSSERELRQTVKWLWIVPSVVFFVFFQCYVVDSRKRAAAPKGEDSIRILSVFTGMMEAMSNAEQSSERWSSEIQCH